MRPNGRMIRKSSLGALLFLCLLVAGPSSGSAETEKDEPEASEKITSPEREAALKIQLFLDGEGFGPGRLDGRWGEFTRKATLRWNQANPDREIPLTDADEPEMDQLGQVGWNKPLTTEYTVTDEDAARIGTVPAEPEDQAKKESLPYTSLLELVAEKFHAYPDLLVELNELGDSASLSAGQQLKVPNVDRPFDLSGPEEAQREAEEKESENGDEKSAGDGSEDERSGTLELRIDREEKILEAYQDGKLVHSFPITPGSAANPAPAGDWEVDVVAWMPTFRYDRQMLDEGTRSDDAHHLPPGPNNPVGIVWIGLNRDGIGVHGTTNPDDIGRNASHGCIRLSNWDAYTLGQKVDMGVKVRIE